jgi:SagB-type dehydrogenase family enzyme
MRWLYLTGAFIFFLTMIDFTSKSEEIKLPSSDKKGKVSLEETLNIRKSVRKYLPHPLKIKEISQILWASYGVNKWGRLTSPSAGALYPLTIYLVAGNIEDLPSGLYKYNNKRHSLKLISSQDLRSSLYKACLGQDWVKKAAALIVICANYDITTSYYGKRGKRYVDIEIGHVGQNIYLQTTALGLGTVAVGAFYDEEVKNILNIKEDPLYIMPIGRVK